MVKGAESVELFKVMVAKRGPLNLDNALDGFVTDFVPTDHQIALLRKLFRPLPIRTLFSVEERATASPYELIHKQLLHYFEVYGLDAPGLFNLEVSNGQMASLAFIKAVTVEGLTALVHGLIYANRPIADTAPVLELIRGYRLPYDINAVQNNEMRVVLFDPHKDRFASGDDAARYICYHATNSSMLIKSKGVIAAVKAKPVGEAFLSNHITPLAQVFNRHERIIMACKTKASRNVVNRISKLSKKKHVPIHEPISKRFIATALNGDIPPLELVSLRDKFKYLNLIEYKLLGLPYDSFNIRNGKVWTRTDRNAADRRRLLRIQDAVLASIAVDVRHLRGTRLLLDACVDYGLPISRKQALGNLPYGTKVLAQGDAKLSAGIYWVGRNTDLDLSAINDRGERTGWGQWSAYSRGAEIVYSGDVTSAPNGASEFMVVDPRKKNRYGLMVNIFRGDKPHDAEIVVGYPDGQKWQDKTLIREKITLSSTMSIIGFLKDNAFVVYSGQLSNARVSRGHHPIIAKALGRLWTLKDILDVTQVPYDVEPRDGVVYDHDLRYTSFSLDKLEGLLKI